MKLISIILCSLAACAFSVQPTGSGEELTTPRVLSSIPADGATGVSLDGSVSATFSEAMDPATLTAATFTLIDETNLVPISGTVLYADSTVVFKPDVDLVRGAIYTATISTDANSGTGVALAATYVWSFTGVVGAGGVPVNLRTAGTYAVLAAASISGTGATVTGNLGISPAAASYITGFSLMADASTEFSTSAQVTGRVYAADYGVPTPAKLGIAINDMRLAYAEAAAREPGIIDLGVGNIGGMTLAPGVYRWTNGVSVPTSVTLAGSSSDVWILQVTGTLNVAAVMSVNLTGGALSKNVFWQVSGAVTLGATAHLEGVVLTATAFTSGAGTSIRGTVLSQTDVTITGSTVLQPAP